MTSSFSWNSPWLASNEMWMVSRRVYRTLQVTDVFYGVNGKYVM